MASILDNNLEYIKSLRSDASIVVNQEGQDWLARISQITDPIKTELNARLSSISNSMSTLRTNLESAIGNVRDNSKSYVDNIISNYYNKVEIDTKVENYEEYLAQQVRTTLLHYVRWVDLEGENGILLNEISSYAYSKGIIDTRLTTLRDIIDTNRNYAENSINSLKQSTALLQQSIRDIEDNYLLEDSVLDIVNEAIQTTPLTNYYTKEEVDNLVNDKVEEVDNDWKNYVDKALTPPHITIKKISENDNPFEDGYITRYEHGNDIDDVKNYVKEQLNTNLQHYVKKVDFTYQLNRLQSNITLQLENTFSKYLTRTEIDKKFADIGKAFVQIVTPQEFRVLKSKNLVKENNLYLVSKYGKPQEFYIGKILIAKRNDELSQGFAYTFPITF